MVYRYKVGVYVHNYMVCACTCVYVCVYMGPTNYVLLGVLNLHDNRDEDGGFQCVPGFHLNFEEYFKSIKRDDESQAYNFKPRDIPYKQAVRISMRAGSMVVWDQRMAHGSKPNASSRFR